MVDQRPDVNVLACNPLEVFASLMSHDLITIATGGKLCAGYSSLSSSCVQWPDGEVVTRVLRGERIGIMTALHEISSSILDSAHVLLFGSRENRRDVFCGHTPIMWEKKRDTGLWLCSS